MQALNLLAVMAAIRLDEKSDMIETILLSLDALPAQGKRSAISTDPLASSTWEEVIFNYFLH